VPDAANARHPRGACRAVRHRLPARPDFHRPRLPERARAIGFNFDDGGECAELGSDLLRRQYTIEVWVMGLSGAEGRNLANAVRDSMEFDAVVPLKDITAAGQPVIDYLMVDPVSVQRQPVPEPKPWQEFLWIVSIPVIDEYHARG
jgi:hypothetical protein